MAFILLTFSVSGCAAPADGPAGNPDGGVLRFEIGTSDIEADRSYVPMTAQVVGQSGSQGGFHVDLMYRLPEGGVGNITFNHQAKLASSGALVSKGRRTYRLGPDPVTGWTTEEPARMFMCPTSAGVTIIGKRLTIEVTATGDLGEQLGVSTAQTTFVCSSTACESTCEG